MILRILLLLAFAGTAALAKEAKPNVLFIVIDDMNDSISLLDPKSPIKTPNIERLAAEGLTFNHAFSAAPVCSVARTTLATAMHAPRVGFQYHRKSALATLPPGVKPWSQVLREHGYYATNNAKTDYNFKVNMKQAWDMSSNKATWRKRPNKAMPFFHMQSFADSHESRLHFPLKQMETPTKTSPDDVVLQPYFPDTPIMRYTKARYYDRMGIIDGHVGRIVSQLKEDGLLENTFVFYFGDHGGVMPRSKGYAYESGLHVPLVVRIPENFKHLVDHKRGARTDGFVSFIDFGPTVLNLAGIAPHKELDGRAFLGKGATAVDLAKRDEVFGHADRFDEKFDMVRTYRKGSWKYIRNYQAYYADGLQNNYRYRQLAYDNWRDLYRADRLNPVQRQFFERRPVEQLFNLATDPHEVNNLAANPEHAERLKTMREAHYRWVRESRDIGLLPEPEIITREKVYGARYDILRQEGSTAVMKRLGETAALASSGPAALPKLLKAMSDPDAAVRYWGATGAGNIAPKKNANALGAMRKALGDASASVRIAAGRALARMGEPAEALPTLKKALAGPHQWARLQAAIVLDEMEEQARPAIPELKKALTAQPNKYIVRVANRALNDLLGTNNQVR